MDFSPTGTKYFTLTSLAKERPFQAFQDIINLRYDLIESGKEIEYFHATEDRQAVRDQIFDIVKKRLKSARVDSLIVEKRKTGPALQKAEDFYPEMLGHLLQYVINGHDLKKYKKVIVFTDTIPVQRKRKAIEKTIKKTLSQKLPVGVTYLIYHHSSKSNVYLQIADYCNWAIFRKWEIKDDRSYKIIQSIIQSEFDIFRMGTKYYY